MSFERPYVISWNLTYRCNLACEHCYLDAGAKRFQVVKDEAFSDRSELTTEQCYRVVDQIKELAPEAITILTGGEPLLRRDILEIVRYASSEDLWVVMGTNGVTISENLAHTLKDAGLRGFALSLDALDPSSHDRFRRIQGAWKNTVEGARILHRADLSFIVQTTAASHNAGDIEAIADFAYQEMGAKVFNLYFLVQTGRGQYVSDLTPLQYNGVLDALSRIQKKYDGKMIANAKCAPHYVRHLYEREPTSKFLKSYVGGAGGCPAGTQYMGIRPNGDVTPCPYLPLFGGNILREPLTEIWEHSDLFMNIRRRSELGGRCGSCEFNRHCGGCRARAHGMTGDLLAEDPLCDYEPGKVGRDSIHIETEYGLEPTPSRVKETVQETLAWDPDALDRINQIPAFVRGMVRDRVESYCRKNNIQRITSEELARIRSQMPTSKVFG